MGKKHPNDRRYACRKSLPALRRYHSYHFTIFTNSYLWDTAISFSRSSYGYLDPPVIQSETKWELRPFKELISTLVIKLRKLNEGTSYLMATNGEPSRTHLGNSRLTYLASRH